MKTLIRVALFVGLMTLAYVWFGDAAAMLIH